jgi:hypothetical protein
VGEIGHEGGEAGVGGAVEEVREAIEEAIRGMLPELSPLSAGEFLREFEGRTGWKWRFGEPAQTLKELKHGQWKVRVDREEDIVETRGGCYAVEATVMWLIDTYNESFWVIDVDVEGVRPLPEDECREVRRGEDDWEWGEEEGWEEEWEEWDEEMEEWEEEDWEEEEGGEE